MAYCTKPINETEVKPDKEQLRILQNQVANEVLQMVGQTSFRKFVLDKCMQQKHGDYFVYLKEVSEYFANVKGFEKHIPVLNSSIIRIKQLNGGVEPILFYPRAETIAKAKSIREETIRATSVDANTAIVVYQNVYNKDYSAPGYVLDEKGNLAFKMNVTEEFAWNNDVYIVGDEENPGRVVEPVEICSDAPRPGSFIHTGWAKH